MNESGIRFRLGRLLHLKRVIFVLVAICWLTVQYIIPDIVLSYVYPNVSTRVALAILPPALLSAFSLLHSDALLAVGLFTAVALAYLREDSHVTFLRVAISGLGLVIGTVGGAELGAYVTEIGWDPDPEAGSRSLAWLVAGAVVGASLFILSGVAAVALQDRQRLKRRSFWLWGTMLVLMWSAIWVTFYWIGSSMLGQLLLPFLLVPCAAPMIFPAPSKADPPTREA
jgi:hypothetical protein